MCVGNCVMIVLLRLRQCALAILFGLIAHCESSRNPDLRQPKGTDSRLCSAQSHILALTHKSMCLWMGVGLCVGGHACLCAINEGSTNVVNVQIGMEANLTLDTFRYQLKH